MPIKGLREALSPHMLLNRFAMLARVRTSEDIPYGTNPRHRLDVYSPRTAHDAPVAVFFYGGGWEEGERHLYRFVGTALASTGIVTIIPDYRVYPEVTFPGFLEDGARAIAWARTHAWKHGGDGARLVVMGHSAGAHIAGMLALDRRWMEHLVSGFVGLAGPYDFSPDTPARRAIFGERSRAESQPIGFAHADAPPSLLLTGRRDSVVDPGNATRLASRLVAAGAEARTIVYPLVDHASILGAFSPLLRFLAPVYADVTGFVAGVTGANARKLEVAA